MVLKKSIHLSHVIQYWSLGLSNGIFLHDFTSNTPSTAGGDKLNEIQFGQQEAARSSKPHKCLSKHHVC